MGIPQLHNEGVDQGGTSTISVSFAGFTWSAGDILELVIATDGWVPTLTTANGFQLAQDPNGNTASVTTNGGTATTNDCGIFVFWKRAVGSTTTTDPAPVLSAPASGGTCWCLEPNSYTGARSSGTPYHIITTAIVSTATTTVAPPAVTPTLNNCLVMTRVASANDDQAFNNWTMTGSSGPAAGIPASGWHNGSGNACAFTGGDGGYATAGGARSGTTTFATSTKQAQITLVMASLNEPFGAAEDEAHPAGSSPAMPRFTAVPAQDDEIVEIPTAAVDEDIPGAPALPGPVPLLARPPDGEELPVAPAPPSMIEEDAQRAPDVVPVASVPARAPSDDEVVAASAAVVDDDAPAAALVIVPPGVPTVPVVADEIVPAAAPGTAIDEDIPAALPAPPLALVVSPLQLGEELPAQVVTSGIGGAGDMQRSLSQPPQSGTLTTVAPVPAWAQSTAYVVDPSQGGKNRVVNGGNLYQCSTGGTSASSGTGPSGTGTNIADGSTVKWYYVGPAQGTNTTAGSQVLVAIMRGTQSQAATVGPSDNDSGTFTQITNNAYANFTASFAGVWRRDQAANNKTNYQASAVWGGSGGAGDEMSIAWLEIQGVPVGAPHASSHVERLASSGGAVVSAPITTTVPCIIVSFWFGNGNVQAQGTPDAATPSGGLTLIAGCTGPLSLTPNGYIQHMVAWRRQSTPATNFTETWLASPTDEGAQLVTVAFQDLSSPTLGLDDAVSMVPVRAVVAMQPTPVAADDELPVAIALDEPPAAVATAALQPATAPALRTDDELPVMFDEDMPAVGAVPTAPAVLAAPQGAGDDLPVAAAAPFFDDSIGAIAVPAAMVSVLALASSDADLPAPAAPPSIVDDAAAGAAALLAVPTPSTALAALADELPTAAIGFDDDAPPTPQAATAPTTAVLYAAPDDEAVPQVLPSAEEQSWSFAISWAPRSSDLDPDDEALPGWGAPPPLPTWSIDEDQPGGAGGPPVAAVLAALATDDELPAAAAVQLGDPTSAWEDAIYQWVLTGSGLAPSQVIWASGGTAAGSGGPQPAGLYISMRIIDVDQVSDDWIIPRREGAGIVHHVRGTRHPTLELRCFAGDSTGARRAELVLARVGAAVRLPSVAKALRQGAIGVGTFGKVRVLPGVRSGMLDPLAMVEVPLHIMIDVSEAGGEFVSVDVTTPGGVGQTVTKP